MSLSDLLAGSHSPAHEEPVGSSGLGSLVRPDATAVEATFEQPNLARMMQLRRSERPAPKPQSTNASSIADFDRRGMAERLATRRPFT